MPRFGSFRSPFKGRKLKPAKAPVDPRVLGIGTDTFPLGAKVFLRYESDRPPGLKREGTIVGHEKRRLRPSALLVKFAGGGTKSLDPSRLETRTQLAARVKREKAGLPSKERGAIQRFLGDLAAPPSEPKKKAAPKKRKKAATTKKKTTKAPSKTIMKKAN